MTGAAISPWRRTGGCARRAEREVAPFVYAGAAILSPATVRRCAEGRVLAQPHVRPRHRGRAGCTACGSKAPGCMSARRTRSRPPRPRSWRAWRSCHPRAIDGRSSHRAMRSVTTHDAGHAPARLHDSGFGAVPADADRRADGRPAGRGLPGRRDPLALASATLYLPTRRACRSRATRSSTCSKTDAAILPRIVPLGDIDEDELAFADAASGDAEALDIAGRARRARAAHAARATDPEMGRVARACAPAAASRWSPTAPASALALADDLARLIDDMTTRQVRGSRLDELVPRRSRRILAAHARVPADRARVLAGDPRRARQDRAGGAARPADRGRARRGSRRTTAR